MTSHKHRLKMIRSYSTCSSLFLSFNSSSRSSSKLKLLPNNFIQPARQMSSSNQFPAQISCSNRFCYTREVNEAIRNGDPVVALESTIITHGMPYPANLSMAKKTESIIRNLGAVPATVAVLQGNVHVGLSADELEQLATSKSVLKTSRRDFPYILANRMDGGTTVSGTMVVAHRAGIQVFVTGGIGGVHRGATTTMDISADLTELSRTPVMVVSAGVKSILDIGLTLEYLETMGVCVATLGEGRNFPAFYTSDSGFRSPYNVASALEAAKLMKSNLDLNLNTGILLGVPIPAENEGDATIHNAIQQAVGEAEAKGICGKEITPYILSRLNELTSGESLRANIALVENNARVGAEVAVNLANLRNSTGFSPSSREPTGKGGRNNDKRGPVVVGGCNFDFVVQVTQENVQYNGSTNQGKLQYSYGGVGRNVADALSRLGTQPRLVSMVGEDNPGTSILRDNKHIDTSLVKTLASEATATYTVVLDRGGECIFGVGDMEIHNRISREYILSLEDKIAQSPLVVSDGNISEDAIDTLLEVCGKHDVPLFYEPTCMSKAQKPLLSKFSGNMTYCSPNLNELISMLETLPDKPIVPDITCINADTINSLAQLSIRLLKEYSLSVILLTMGKDGVLLTRGGAAHTPLPTKSTLKINRSTDRYSSVYYPGDPTNNVVSVSGAGDCLTAGFITGLLQGDHQDHCVAAGIQAARLSLAVSDAVPNTLDNDVIDWNQNIKSVIII